MRPIQAHGLWLLYNVSSRVCSPSACAQTHHNICSSPESSQYSLESRAVSDKLHNWAVQSSAVRLLGRAVISTLASLVTSQARLLYLPEVTRFCFFLYYCFFFNWVFQRHSKNTQFYRTKTKLRVQRQGLSEICCFLPRTFSRYNFFLLANLLW